VFNANGQVALDIVKGNVDPNSPAAKHQIDGLAGSTLTSNGVERLVQFWLGDNGFGQFISNLRKGEA
jgi:Na+-transporting NADH:ubiquinone oxidoreductase subunit C